MLLPADGDGALPLLGGEPLLADEPELEGASRRSGNGFSSRGCA